MAMGRLGPGPGPKCTCVSGPLPTCILIVHTSCMPDRIHAQLTTFSAVTPYVDVLAFTALIMTTWTWTVQSYCLKIEIGTNLFYCYLCSVYMMSSQHQVMSKFVAE